MWVLNRVREGKLVAGKAVEIFDLSLRQIRRLLSVTANEERRPGCPAIGDANPSIERKNGSDKTLPLAKTIYDGANQQHLTELLSEREGISLSRSTIRRILRRGSIDSSFGRFAMRACGSS